MSGLEWPDRWCAGRVNGERVHLWYAEEEDANEDGSAEDYADGDRGSGQREDHRHGQDGIMRLSIVRIGLRNVVGHRKEVGSSVSVGPHIGRRSRRFRTHISAARQRPAVRDRNNSLQEHHLHRSLSAWSRRHRPCLVVRHESDQPMRPVPAVPDPCDGDAAAPGPARARQRRV